MAGTLTVSDDEMVEGTIKAGVRPTSADGKKPSPFMWYHSGAPPTGGAKGFISTTTETVLVTLDVGGFNNFSLTLHNRDDEEPGSF